MGRYYTLQADHSNLKGVDIGPGKQVDAVDQAAAEAYADRTIEEMLGKAWPAAAVPDTIARIANLLGSAELLSIERRNINRAVGGDAGVSNESDTLRKRGLDEIAAIKRGDRGIRLPDGTPDPRWPGSTNVDEGNSTWTVLYP
jgi:hypothetical protein